MSKQIRKEFITLPLAEINPYPNNPRFNDDAVEDVIQSMRQTGNLDPIEIDENNVILSGHTRLKALQKMGVESTECVRYTGLSEARKKKYRLLANKVGEKASWDPDKLLQELEGMDFEGFDFGFDLDEKKEVREDDYDPDPPEEPHAKTGDVYQLGRHRLMCGDSTKIDDVSKLTDGGGSSAFIDRPSVQCGLRGDCRKDQER